MNAPLDPLPSSGPRARSWSPDGLAVVFLVAIVCATRILTLSSNELSWDVFGYYLYLPATFLHHDPLLTDISWIRSVQEQYHTTGTLYQLNTMPDGRMVYFFLMGTALLYAPFFLCGHLIALLTGAPTDGFSMPYQAAVSLGGVVYTLFALLLLRRILRRFVPASVTAAVLAILTLGTNYFHQVTVKNLETANFLVLVLALLLWNTIRWHEDHRRGHMLGIGFSLGLLTLIKPSEATFGLLPVLWGVHDRASLKAKIAAVRSHVSDVLLAALLAVLVLSPQLLLWKTLTGAWLPYTYNNPGVGLDWSSPHVGPVLFSFRKGWLVYTPVMFLALAGIVFLWREQRERFWGIVVPFLASFYVIASWTEWWHGGCFSNRPMITNYVLLALPLGLALRRMAAARPLIRWSGIGVVVALCALNLFQIWQHDHYVLDPYRNTRAYYFAVFGRTRVPPGAQDLLLVDRVFDGSERFTDEQRYQARPLGSIDMEDGNGPPGHVVQDTLLRSHVLRLDGELPYTPAIEWPFMAVTGGDHFWVRAKVRVRVPAGYAGEMPCLVMTMERREGAYGYRAICVPDSARRDTWFWLEGEFLTPEIRDRQDRFKAYVWCRGGPELLVDDLRATAYTKEHP